MDIIFTLFIGIHYTSFRTFAITQTRVSDGVRGEIVTFTLMKIFPHYLSDIEVYF